jgi:cytochrome c oxidase subunit IV
MNESNQGKRMRLGLVIFIVLMIVEVVEYYVGVGFDRGATIPLVVLAVPGAGLIVYYFMHISQLWHREE